LFSLVLLPAMRAGAVSPYLQVVTHPIIYEFLAGVLIGMLYLWPRIRFPTAAVAWQAVVCTTGFALWYAWSGNGGGHGPQGYGWPLALMLCALALASKTVVLTVPRWLVWTGTVSYSMYLTHFLVQSWLTHWLEHHGMPFRNWNLVFLMLLFAIPVASLSHVLLERGLGEWVRKLLMRALGEKLAQPAAHVIKMSKVAS
jgi:peptidoglycan/LPS O-acetylase OafA/YrhL